MKQWNSFGSRNINLKNTWEETFKKREKEKNFEIFFENKIPLIFKEQINKIKSYHLKEKTNCATRKSSQIALEVINPIIENLIGGSADLTGSNNTKTQELQPIQKNNFTGRYIYYGVREHAMAAIMNGMALHKGLRPYGGTFLVFTDYCRPSIRLASLMKLPIIYVMTHDSIGLGEDGPTHQPIEHLSSLRAIPNLIVIRPCDIIETIEAWEYALNQNNSPILLVLTRQNLPLIRKNHSNNNLLQKGAYPIIDFDNYDATILATGSEVEIAKEASHKLSKMNLNIRVISFPSWELFTKQPKDYKKKIIGNKPCFAIEAGIINGWEKYISPENFIGMSSFGASGKFQELYEHFDITNNSLAKLIKKKL